MTAGMAKAEAEHAKVGVRSARKEANNEVKKLDVSDDMKKNVEADVQQLTDTFVKKTEELFDLKDQDIGDWNLLSVNTTANMFEDAISFNKNINNWNVLAVTDMSFMFDKAKR